MTPGAIGLTSESVFLVILDVIPGAIGAVAVVVVVVEIVYNIYSSTLYHPGIWLFDNPGNRVHLLAIFSLFYYFVISVSLLNNTKICIDNLFLIVCIH